MMRWLKLFALILFSIPPAAADGLAENPAFCFGFISALSQKETDALWHRKPHIRSLFAKIGPKDSTDERGFNDWERIGREIASDRGSKRRATLQEQCRQLLGADRN